MRKNLLFTAVAVLLAASCSPVKIYMDSTASDGTRKVVTTQETILRNGKGALGLSMGASVKDADTVVAILAVLDADTRRRGADKERRLRVLVHRHGNLNGKPLFRRRQEIRRADRQTAPIGGAACAM